MNPQKNKPTLMSKIGDWFEQPTTQTKASMALFFCLVNIRTNEPIVYIFTLIMSIVLIYQLVKGYVR